MNSLNSDAQATNRRRFFRIDDAINLYYKVIDSPTQDISQVSTDILGACSLTAALEMLTEEAKVVLRRVEHRAPEVADYLKILDNKIALLAKALAGQNTTFSESQIRQVNLSASGLAFENDLALHVGDYLEVKMVLSSLAVVIALHAKVVYCKANTSTQNTALPFLVGLEYVNIQERDRDLLIKHIMRRQMQQIKASRNPDIQLR